MWRAFARHRDGPYVAQLPDENDGQTKNEARAHAREILVTQYIQGTLPAQQLGELRHHLVLAGATGLADLASVNGAVTIARSVWLLRECLLRLCSP